MKGTRFWSVGVSVPSVFPAYDLQEKVLEHFQHAAEEYGVLPHVRFRCNVEALDVVGERHAAAGKGGGSSRSLLFRGIHVIGGWGYFQILVVTTV